MSERHFTTKVKLFMKIFEDKNTTTVKNLKCAFFDVLFLIFKTHATSLLGEEC